MTKRYILTGGTMAFIQGRRVDVGETFELPDDWKPPRFSQELKEDEPVPEGAVEVDDKRVMAEEIRQAVQETRRATDEEPIKD